jgi:EAL domain-containing protein (putative c-di-GMP-specific phosphodiesterase class I)
MSAVLQQAVLLEGQNISLGGGIGLASFPEHGEEISTLLRHAEQAMYEAKRHNTGFAVFDSSLDAEDPQHLSLMSELRLAVDLGQLELHYQPKLSLKDGAVRHAEALVRWRHPERGLISPGKFIPYAEKTGFIRAITAWAVGEALGQIAAWKGRGLSLVVSINLSARDLMNVELPALFQAHLSGRNADPGSLILEITESAIMADPARALDILNRLHAMGLHLSIDDFGTGYSSLAYLKKLPVSELKIDQSFVTHMTRDRDDAIIVRSVIDLGHNMGLEVVAEGIEDQATQELLGAMGCDLAQGYHIQRPVPAAALEAWILRASAATERDA